MDERKISSFRGTERNYGIDLLRLLAMLMVVVVHIANQGGASTCADGVKRYAVAAIEYMAICCVDVYAVISGYVGYRETRPKRRTSKYLKMWFGVFFYSLGISLAALFARPDIMTFENVVKSAFPVISLAYWYFSSYTVVFFLAPWINGFISRLDNKDTTKLALLSVGLFSVVSFASNFFQTDPFVLNGGYSPLWLLVLYVVGAWMKKCGVFGKTGKLTLLLLIIGDYALMCVIAYVIPQGSLGISGYTSPFVLAIAIFCVALFSKIKFSRFVNGIIAFLAPAAFGVYLIHTHPFIYNNVLKDAFLWVSDVSVFAIPFVIVGSAVVIMAVCLAAEKLRLWLFKVTRFDDLLDFSGNKIDGIVDGTFSAKE